jgi:acetyl-CoA C-acetyltransferase
MESLSNAPYYVMPPVRSGLRMGHGRLVDGMLHDGLWDVYNDQHMGMCGEACASKFGISRQDQDEYAIESYRRAAAAWEGGMLAEEVFPMEVQNKRVKVRVDKDDEVSNIELAGVTSQKPAFLREGGTVTAANSSTLNDGAAVMIMMSEERAKELGVAPLARILGYADAARSPVEFTIAPSDAIPLALGRAGVSKTDIGAWEINEAFAVVALANSKLSGSFLRFHLS